MLHFVQIEDDLIELKELWGITGLNVLETLRNESLTTLITHFVIIYPIHHSKYPNLP